MAGLAAGRRASADASRTACRPIAIASIPFARSVSRYASTLARRAFTRNVNGPWRSPAARIACHASGHARFTESTHHAR